MEATVIQTKTRNANSGFAACFKKEVMENLRTHKLLIFVGIGVGIVLFAFITLLMMWGINELVEDFDEFGQIMQMFDLNYMSSTMMFTSYMITYLTIVAVVLFRNLISKEIKDKKWILPMQAGINSRNIILARILVNLLTVLVAIAICCLLHFALTMAICKPLDVTKDGWDHLVGQFGAGEQIGTMFLSYLFMMLAIVFYCIITIALNAMTKKQWLAILIPLFILMVIETVFNMVHYRSGDFVNGVEITYALANWTPLLFSSQAVAMLPLSGQHYASVVIVQPTTAHWVVASNTLVLISAALIAGCVLLNRVKASK
ncbi:MAG: ABC transporter permease [Firmicutes bacterium]|nr:ABC transporter permease [Bacillota bacterium]